MKPRGFSKTKRTSKSISKKARAKRSKSRAKTKVKAAIKLKRAARKQEELLKAEEDYQLIQETERLKNEIQAKLIQKSAATKTIVDRILEKQAELEGLTSDCVSHKTA